jgi:hypothetical protein
MRKRREEGRGGGGKGGRVSEEIAFFMRGVRQHSDAVLSER